VRVIDGRHISRRRITQTCSKSQAAQLLGYIVKVSFLMCTYMVLLDESEYYLHFNMTECLGPGTLDHIITRESFG